MKLLSVLVVLCAVQLASSSALRELEDFIRHRKRGCEYVCKNGEGCLKEVHMCNGHNDCTDGSDEDIAYCEKNDLCLFTCARFRSTRKMCIKNVMLCDDKPHCDGGEDEQIATCEQYGKCKIRCEVKNPHTLQWYDDCLDETRICNRQVDCRDKRDEQHDACVMVGKENKECELMCPGENEYLCVRPDRICDKRRDCPDTGADEDQANCHLRPARGLELLEELLNSVQK